MIQTLRRRVIFIPLLVVLVASVSGGVVAAQALTGGGAGKHDKLFDRTAEILGIDPIELKDAFEQAGAELADEKVDSLLADLVANGHLTDEQQAEIQEWLDTIPESIGTISAATLRELLDGEGPTFRSALRIGKPLLSGALIHGDLTQEQLDAISTWLDSFPESLLDLGVNEAIEFLRIQSDRAANDEDRLPPTAGGLVEAGIIDEAQAADLQAWWDGRPDEVDAMLPGAFQLGLPSLEKYFFEGDPGGLQMIPKLMERFPGFEGFGGGGRGFEFELPRPGEHDRPFRFEFGGGDPFQFGNGGPMGIPYLGELRDLSPEELRKRIEEHMGEFDGSGRFEFKFGDGEPFHFEFGEPEADDSDEPTGSPTLNRAA
ncbi:MAG: hypothetical protein HQ478_02480 [Chloroflexi bacterium]|nr:hypothetical protein [Chloroflexota bacterium]